MAQLKQFNNFLEKENIRGMNLVQPDYKVSEILNCLWENYQRSLHNARVCRADENMDYYMLTSGRNPYMALDSYRSEFQDLHICYGKLQQDRIVAIYINNLNDRIVDVEDAILEAKRDLKKNDQESELIYFCNKINRLVKNLHEAQDELAREKIIRQVRAAQIKNFLKRKL